MSEIEILLVDKERARFVPMGQNPTPSVPYKTWKERKAERDAYTNEQLKRVFVLKPEFNKPGMQFKTVDGTEYFIAADGSRRRVR